MKKIVCPAFAAHSGRAVRWFKRVAALDTSFLLLSPATSGRSSGPLRYADADPGKAVQDYDIRSPCLAASPFHGAPATKTRPFWLTIATPLFNVNESIEK
ncbi:MAG: hypothetical protein PVSMB7_05700 [Chloroflexota bacterium]